MDKKLVEEAASAITRLRPHPGGGSEIVYEDSKDYAREVLRVFQKLTGSEVKRLINVERDYDSNFPCDGGCNVNSGPEEMCSRHGRSPRDLWARLHEQEREN